MKRSTAIRHLSEMAEVASDHLRLRDSNIGWPLEEIWVAGDLLGLADTMNAGIVVLVVDAPTVEMPWLARHDGGEWIGRELRLGKRPLQWFYRPLGWPVWNHDLRRVARCWSAGGGVDQDALDALGARRLDRLAVVAPTDAEVVAQLRVELAASRRYLRDIIGPYWDEGWRRRHRGGDDASPEDHLWRAATAVSEMTDALDALDPGRESTPM